MRMRRDPQRGSCRPLGTASEVKNEPLWKQPKLRDVGGWGLLRGLSFVCAPDELPDALESVVALVALC